MIHAREDYQRAIVDTRGPFDADSEANIGKAIPENEPVFLLRAQDPVAHEAVRIYANLIAARARNGADIAFARLAHRHADRMQEWPVKKAFPDAPGINDGVGFVDQAPADTFRPRTVLTLSARFRCVSQPEELHVQSEHDIDHEAGRLDWPEDPRRQAEFLAAEMAPPLWGLIQAAMLRHAWPETKRAEDPS